MCGIAGIISTNTDETSNGITGKMATSLAHRGPDGEFTWRNAKGNVGFGFRRLAILDLSSRGNQPMHYLQRYTIVHNGEIYNYIELKETLQKEGTNFSTESDTEVILAMYAKYKYDCVKYFDGMFAFAIWDEEEQTLFAARDRFGEKPFFYKWDKLNRRFSFASEMKALWAAGEDKQVNDKMLYAFISLGFTQNPLDNSTTFYKDIKKLPGRSVLIYDFPANTLSVTPYWDIDLKERSSLKEDDAIQKFTELFKLSVSRRLRSDVEVGTSLSGGLDSSSIVAMIDSIAGSSIKSFSTFSAIFKGFEKDESRYIRMVTEKYPVNNYQAQPTLEGFLEDMQQLSYFQEEPFTSSSCYAQYKVYQLAAQKGVKVLLDGQGADETLAGYTKYYQWFWQELLRTGGIGAVDKERKETALSEIQWNSSNKLAAYLPGMASKALTNKLLRMQKQQASITGSYATSNFDPRFAYKPVVKRLDDLLYFNVFQMGLEELLRFADRNSMAHGREIRLPFLSHELVAFVFSLPSTYKLRHGFTKWILRMSMEKQLPAEIVWRKDKVGFEPPQKRWMQDERLKGVIQDSKRKLISTGILVPGALQLPVRPTGAYEAENADWRYLSAAQLL